jgi:hypothetical protein
LKNEKARPARLIALSMPVIIEPKLPSTPEKLSRPTISIST